jgi:hypothetical protein
VFGRAERIESCIGHRYSDHDCVQLKLAGQSYGSPSRPLPQHAPAGLALGPVCGMGLCGDLHSPQRTIEARRHIDNNGFPAAGCDVRLLWRRKQPDGSQRRHASWDLLSNGYGDIRLGFGDPCNMKSS